MKQTTLRIGVTVLVLFLFALLASCQSTPEEIPEDLSKAQMFQHAQEEVDSENYDLALRYYREFIRRNPDDTGSIIEAEYEIAYIAYKQEDYAVAQERFEALLTQYEADQAGVLPDWPEVLSLKLLEIIEQRIAEEEAPLIQTNLDNGSEDTNREEPQAENAE